jgi:hypothetical protein
MYRPSFPEAPMMQTFMSADYLTPRPLPGAPPSQGVFTGDQPDPAYARSADDEKDGLMT